MELKKGAVVTYLKTGTTGKIVDVHRIDGKLWAELDTTGLLYEEHVLEPIKSSKANIERVEDKSNAQKEKLSRDKKIESAQKDMKDEGKIDTSGEICGAG
ncbi:MAG: DUF2098 domain-containing protein [Candidatus Methanomethylicia archaeon]|nr:DUF2098 domain-containing protein [Candidatus Methanomethylicia archaeon]